MGKPLAAAVTRALCNRAESLPVTVSPPTRGSDAAARASPALVGRGL